MIIEDKNIINNEEKDIINNQILGNEFPFYWHPYQIIGDDCPYMRHNIIDRDTQEVRSNIINLFNPIVQRFLKKYNLNFKKYLRGCINLTFPMKNDNIGKPHVDHIIPHSSMIIYLNDSDGETIFFDYNYDFLKDEQSNFIELNKNKKILKEIKPEKYKIVYIKDSLFHCLRFPKKDRRLISVFTFV